jgi:hypothetical protein
VPGLLLLGGELLLRVVRVGSHRAKLGGAHRTTERAHALLSAQEITLGVGHDGHGRDRTGEKADHADTDRGSDVKDTLDRAVTVAAELRARMLKLRVARSFKAPSLER